MVIYTQHMKNFKHLKEAKTYGLWETLSVSEVGTLPSPPQWESRFFLPSPRGSWFRGVVLKAGPFFPDISQTVLHCVFNQSLNVDCLLLPNSNFQSAFVTGPHSSTLLRFG